MKATVFTSTATMHGIEGRIEIAIDAFGPKMTFTAEGREDSVMTGDDAMFANEFIACRYDLQDEWKQANETAYVFEAGGYMPYEGLYDARLFTDFNDAVAHAESVADDWMKAEVYARELISKTERGS